MEINNEKWYITNGGELVTLVNKVGMVRHAVAQARGALIDALRETDGKEAPAGLVAKIGLAIAACDLAELRVIALDLLDPAAGMDVEEFPYDYRPAKETEPTPPSDGAAEKTPPHFVLNPPKPKEGGGSGTVVAEVEPAPAPSPSQPPVSRPHVQFDSL